MENFYQQVRKTGLSVGQYKKFENVFNCHRAIWWKDSMKKLNELYRTENNK